MDDNEGIKGKDEEIKKQEEQAKFEALRISVFVSNTMNEKSGRDFVWHLLTEYGVFQDPFNENAIAMARDVGVKGAGLMLLKLILSECPDKYNLMFTEHKLKEENDG